MPWAPDDSLWPVHPPVVRDIPIVHADAFVVVVDKPAGLLSVPGIGPANADCVPVRLEPTFPGVRIVHRLDQPTSGLMILALDADTHRELSRQFEHREVEKTYVAVAHGVIEDDDGEIDLPIRLDVDNRPYQIVDHVHGKQAHTRYRVVERHPDRTRVELFPKTGRSHQLRVHLAEIGHPILGDDLYAPGEVRAMSKRLLLHATELVVTHPGTGERVGFRSVAGF